MAGVQRVPRAGGNGRARRGAIRARAAVRSAALKDERAPTGSRVESSAVAHRYDRGSGTNNAEPDLMKSVEWLRKARRLRRATSSVQHDTWRTARSTQPTPRTASYWPWPTEPCVRVRPCLSASLLAHASPRMQHAAVTVPLRVRASTAALAGAGAYGFIGRCMHVRVAPCASVQVCAVCIAHSSTGHSTGHFP